MPQDKWFRVELKELLVYIFIGILLFVLLPMTGGFILGGFSESFGPGGFNISTYLGAFVVYFFLMIGALALIIFPVARLFLLSRGQHPATQDKPSWWTLFTVSLIHSPEENGVLYRLFESIGLKGRKNPMKFSISMFRIFIISILIFGTLGILTIVYPQISISSAPQTSQQVSVVSDVIFGSGIPAYVENGFLMFVFFLALGFNAYLCSRFRLGLVGFFLIGFIFICPIMGFDWMLTHSLIYSNQETKLIATFIFGWVGSTLTLLTASFIPMLSWHFFNNFAIKLAEYSSSNEDLFFIAILVLVGIFVLWVLGELILRKFRKKPPEIPPSPQ